MRLFLLCLIGLFLGACSNQSAIKKRAVESDAGAALFRHLIAHCPHTTETRKMCLTIGPEQAAPTDEFLAKLPEFQSRLLKHSQITVTSLEGKSRVLERTKSMISGELVLLLQVSEMTSAGGNYRAVAAWAYKDDMVRQRFTIIPGENGNFKIEDGEIIEKRPP